MTYTIKLRRGVAADWAAINPILADGEFGHEIDTRYFKLGDGVTPWNDLEYTVDADQYVPDATGLPDGQILLTDNESWVITDLPSGLPDATGQPDGKILLTDNEDWVIGDAPTGGGGGGGSRFVDGFIDGTLAPLIGTNRIYNDTGGPLTVSRVRVFVVTPPTGSPAVFDVHVDGTTIFTNQANRPSIPAGQQTALVTTIDAPTWPDGGYITVDIDAANNAADLTFQLEATPS